MSKYFSTQIKRLWRLLPIVLVVALLISCSIYFVYQGLMDRWTKNETFQKFNIGLVGISNEPSLQMGLEAVKTMDSSNMTLEFIEMDEQTAVKQLTSGKLAAYIVFPDGFLDNALSGIITPLRFVSSSGGENIVSLVTDELTSSLATLLLSSEYGSYALGNALESYGYDESYQYEHLNRLAMEYAQRVLERDMIYEVQEIGISEGFQGESFGEYLICGLSVVLLFLLTLPFVAVFSKDDLAMSRLLKSRGVGAFSQTVCENGAYCLMFWILSFGMLLMVGKFSVVGIFHIFPVAFCIASISYLIYNICRDLLSGVLLQLVLSVAICFVSGCFYPVYFFPLSIQNMAKYLPAAIAREHIASLITEGEANKAGILLLAIGFGCTLVSALIRYVRVVSGRGTKQ